jgi:hypothetical protein
VKRRIEEEGEMRVVREIVEVRRFGKSFVGVLLSSGERVMARLRSARRSRGEGADGDMVGVAAVRCCLAGEVEDAERCLRFEVGILTRLGLSLVQTSGLCRPHSPCAGNFV